MDVDFVAQPNRQLGRLIEAALASRRRPTDVIIVSAFASLQTVLRLKKRLLQLHDGGARVRIVVGVDLGGTSKDVLKELADWPVEVYAFKNRKRGVTFHPKIYLIRSTDRAQLFLGSNNLTDGGLFKNYEGATHISYELPADQGEFDRATAQLAGFLVPQPPVGRVLDASYAKILLARTDIPSEAQSRERKRSARIDGRVLAGEDGFGYEPTPDSPELPVEVHEVVVAAVRGQLEDLRKKASAETRAAGKAAKKTSGGKSKAKRPIRKQHYLLSNTPIAQISPDAFYMELVKTRGGRGFPGEQRIPLEAIASAREFWGWPHNYTRSVNPRKGKNAAAKGRRGKNGRKRKKGTDRVYWNSRPTWRVTQEGSANRKREVATRMYFSEANSDFRITSGPLKTWGAARDIVRITRSDLPGIDYECSLAKKGTDLHAQWQALCGNESRQSGRRFGFS